MSSRSPPACGRDLIGDDTAHAVGRKVAGCGKDRLLRLGIGLRGGALLAEARRPLVGERLLFLTSWLFGRSSLESFG